jgi:predicted nucleotidyltransferase
MKNSFMIYNRNLILSDLKGIISSRFRDNLKDIILFGSQLSGNTNQGSDYDILIILKQSPDWKTEREISDLCYEIDLKYGIITDTHILSENDLDSLKGKQPIFVNALNKGIYA